LHLDGLADVADALGSGKAPQPARAIMKDPSVGAFGVMTLVLVLVLQVVALGSVMSRQPRRSRWSSPQ
jgi:adenosylcobinamide-GDP ribazoletransferase